MLQSGPIAGLDPPTRRLENVRVSDFVADSIVPLFLVLILEQSAGDPDLVLGCGVTVRPRDRTALAECAPERVGDLDAQRFQVQDSL